ncbi:hypothetical protein UFOVP1299_11 [uncultured Caudovirales phage]|uniref:Uncharacterized protein n=1 Tax=uncultured Caudovirales phage TaxID=2100421 RepID=A0A6J5RDY4_9CAUD|nr:hypothetical protein UFOVP1299_11 [uncultured Caudovirales phage]
MRDKYVPPNQWSAEDLIILQEGWCVKSTPTKELSGLLGRSEMSIRIKAADKKWRRKPEYVSAVRKRSAGESRG